MAIAQPPAMVPQEIHLKVQKERDYWRNRCLEAEKQLTQEKQRQQQRRKLWQTKLKSTEKATLEEFDRQLQSPHTPQDEQGFKRLCYSTAAINTGTTPNTPKLSFEKILSQCPDLLQLAGAQIETRSEYDPDLRRPIPRLYMKTEKSLVEAAVHSEISQRIKQGGNQYQCQNPTCLSTNVRINRRLVCLDCGHEVDLDPTFPNGKLNSTTGINGNTNLEAAPQMGYSSEDDEPSPAENFLTTSSEVVGMVITSITIDPPLEADRLEAVEISAEGERESVSDVITGAAELLLAIVGQVERHIEMSRTGPKKYYTVNRSLELADLVEHFQAGLARGVWLRCQDGQARALCFDADDTDGWKLLQQAARCLVQAGYLVILEESPAHHGGHLWILFDGPVCAEAARSAVLQIVPGLAEIAEYWPAPAGVAAWNPVRLPGGYYVRYGKHVEQPVKAWCRLTGVATGETSQDGRSAAKILLANVTPASIVPALSVIESELAPEVPAQYDQDEQPEAPAIPVGRAGVLRNSDDQDQASVRLPEVDARWIAEHGLVETTTLYFAILPNYAAESYNRDHPLEEIRPREQNGMAFSPNGSERTPSTSYHEAESGERYTDHSQHGRRGDGTRDSGDALELTSKVQGIGKRELFRMSTGQIVAKARADLEAAARSGQPIPDWLESPICIITPAGRRQYERWLSEARSAEQQSEQPASVPFTIYVDDIQTYQTTLPHKRWCHLAIAGPIEELHTFASKLGLKRGWFQNKPTHPHYDVTPAKRAQAIKLGAVAVSTLELVKRCYPDMVSSAPTLEQQADPAATLPAHDQVEQDGGQAESPEQKPVLVKDQRVSTPAGLATISLVRYCDILHRWRCSVFTEAVLPNGSHYAIFDAAEVEPVEQGRLL